MKATRLSMCRRQDFGDCNASQTVSSMREIEDRNRALLTPALMEVQGLPADRHLDRRDRVFRAIPSQAQWSRRASSDDVTAQTSSQTPSQ